MIRLTGVLLLMAAGTSFAQHSSGYLFAGPVGVANSFYTNWQGTLVNVGGGGEKGIGQHFAIGGEAGALIPTQQFGSAVALLSVNPAVYFRPGRPRLDPYVAGGVGVLTRGGSAFVWNIGGGVNYWFSNHVGLRIDVRDHIWPTEGTNLHLAGVRFGLAFRGGP
jgi:hypothetical protein